MLKEEKTTTSWWLFMPLLSWLSVASFHLLMRPRHRDNFIMVDGRPAAFVPRISDSWDNFILRQKMKLFYLNQMKRNRLFNFSTISSVLSFVNDWTHASTLSCRLRGPTVWKIKTSFHSWFFFLSLSLSTYFLLVLVGFFFRRLISWATKAGIVAHRHRSPNEEPNAIVVALPPTNFWRRKNERWKIRLPFSFHLVWARIINSILRNWGGNALLFITA